jgi:hypothetical protein
LVHRVVSSARLDPDRIKRKIQYQLLAINLIIIILDLGLLVAEYLTVSQMYSPEMMNSCIQKPVIWIFSMIL